MTPERLGLLVMPPSRRFCVSCRCAWCWASPLVRQIRLAPPLGELLEGEGLILELIGAVLAQLLLKLALGLLQRLGGGVAIGALCGSLARWLGLSEAACDAGAVVAATVQQQPGGK